jgi:hypothetical protein
MKGGWIGLGLLIALVAEVVLFAGVGFGSGALAAVTSPSSPAASYTSTLGHLSTAIDIEVTIPSVVDGQAITTSMINAGTSTSITWDIQMWDPYWTGGPSGNCANSGDPVFAPGHGANTASYTVQFGSTAWEGTLDGAPVSSTSGGTLTVPANDQSLLAYCFYDNDPGQVGDWVSSSLQGGSSGTVFYDQHTLVINGVWSPSPFTVTYTAQGTQCDGSTGDAGGTVCDYAKSQPSLAGFGGSGLGANGALNGKATFTTDTQSAYSYIMGPGSYVWNGGTLTITAYTGYDQQPDGQSGYTLTMEYPQARPNGGQEDPAFAPINVPQLCLDGCSESWTVPAGTAEDSSIQGWNEFTAVLTLPYYAGSFVNVNVDIFPNSGPNAPTITMSNTGNFGGPQIGDTETASIVSTPTAHSGNLSSINVVAYYVPENGVGGAIPSCQYFVTSITCPGGNFLTGSYSGTTLTVSFSFVVEPPLGSQEVCIQAFSESTEQQASNTTTQCVNVVPASCSPTGTGCPVKMGYWTWLGPALLSAIIITALLVVAFFIPMPPWTMVVLPVVGAVIVALLYLLSIYSVWFRPGGVLG